MGNAEKMKKDLSKKIEDFNVNLAYIQDLLTVYNLLTDSKEKILSEKFTHISQCGIYDSFIMALARLYDKSDEAETIPNLLDKCMKNIHLVDNKDEFQQKIDEYKNKLESDEYIKPAIKTITKRRDKVHAHNDKKLFGRKIINDKTYLPMYQIWFLTDFTEEILKYLSKTFNAKSKETTYSKKYY